jgi:hypothetical protein
MPVERGFEDVAGLHVGLARSVGHRGGHESDLPKSATMGVEVGAIVEGFAGASVLGQGIQHEVIARKLGFVTQALLLNQVSKDHG